MLAEYRIDLTNTSGVKVAESVSFQSLSYKKQVNAPGVARFVLSSADSSAQYVVPGVQARVYRRNTSYGLTSWVEDFTGFITGLREDTEGIETRITATVVGVVSMLGWRINAFPANTTNRSVFSAQKAETIMKTLVEYNLGASATVDNGRIRDGVITGFSVQADAAGGNTITWNNAYTNVLDDLQKLAFVGGGDFDVIRTGSATFEFRFYPGQRGTDRTATVVFSQDYGTIGNITYEYNQAEWDTVAIVGGEGEGVSRQLAVRTGGGYDINTANFEFFVDAKDVKTGTNGLNARGDARLVERRIVENFDFDVLQTPSTYYGVHYFLGDLVTVQYNTQNLTYKITGVQVSATRNAGEAIVVDTELVL